MNVVLNQSMKPIPAGFAAQGIELKVVAHGRTEEMARRNLERVTLSLLRPFERDGTLRDELRLAGIEIENDGLALTVLVV